MFSDEKKVEVLREAEQSGKSIQEVCRMHGISEPTFHLWRKKFGSLKENEVKRLLELEKENLRLKRLHAVARWNGWQVNIKKVRRLCRLQGLLIPKKRHRKRWKGSGRRPCKAEYLNHVWPYDFMYDSYEKSQKIKFLTVMEEYTRYCLCIEVDHGGPKNGD